MRILIVVPKYSAVGIDQYAANGTSITYDYYYPLGLLYISAALKAAGYDVHCLNTNHYEGTVEELLREKIAKLGGYDYVLTGGLSIEFKRVRNVVNAVRSVSTKSKLILGGGLITSEPELMFDVLAPDYIVIGEGDVTIVELIAALERGSDVRDVPGVGYLTPDGHFKCTSERDALMELDSLPWPDYDALEYEKILDNQKNDSVSYDQVDDVRMYCISGSRSCPFKCTFCFHPLGPKYRQRGLDSIMGELEERVTRYRINFITIYDELFAYKRERVLEFCRRIKKFIDGLDWECKWICSLRVNNVDDELLKVMKASGCFAVSYGFESYSPEVLMSMKKGTKPEMIDRAIELMNKNNLLTTANFIFGDPAETKDSIRTTLAYWRKHSYLGLGLFFIQPYPGTAVYNYCISKGLIKDKLDFIENHLRDKRNMSEHLSDMEFQLLVVEVDITLRRDRLSSTPHSLSLMKDGRYQVAVRCPRCGKDNTYRNRVIPSLRLYNIPFSCRGCMSSFSAVSRLQKLINLALVTVYSIMPKSLVFYSYMLFKRFKYGSKAKA